MVKQKLTFVILLNLIIIISEFLFSYISGSISLFTDAFHNWHDVIALLIGYIAIVLSEKKASKKMTYGYIRIEMMAGFINSILLIVAMLFNIYQAIKRIIFPIETQSIYMISVAFIAFLANSLSVLILKSISNYEDKNFIINHHHNENLNIKSMFLHLLSDAGFSFGIAVIGVIVMKTNYKVLDPLYSILFAFYILYESIKILKNTFNSLIDAGIDNLDLIQNKILAHNIIDSIHDIHISKPSSNEIYFSAHIVLKENLNIKEIEQLFETIRIELKEFGITHALFQPETIKYTNNNILCNPH